MHLLKIDTQLKRVWVFNKRLHHGLVGFALFIVGSALMIDDWHDIPWLYDDTEQ